MPATLAFAEHFPYLPVRKAGLDGTLVNPVRSGTKQPHASPCRVRFSLPLTQRPKSIQRIDFSGVPKSLAILGSAKVYFAHNTSMSSTLPSPAIVAILAGGKAKRFDGQDKGEIRIKGERLIDIIYEVVKTQTTEVILSGTHDYGLGLTIIPDAHSAPGGPVGGLYSIWKTLQGREAEGFFTVAVDGPNLPQDLTASLYSKTVSTIAADDAGRHPTYGWWRMDDLSRAWKTAKLSESISLNKLANLVDAKSINWEGESFFTNINRQADLNRFVKGA